MPEPPLNLVLDPWIEATDADGAPQLLSLTDALTSAPATAALGGHPPVAAAVTRLLLAVLRDSLGVAAVAEHTWRAWWRRGDWDTDRVAAYLQRHAHRFDLHGPHPFMQDPGLSDLDGKGGAWKTTAELRPDIPAGNNPVLYEHATDLGGSRPHTMTPPDAARWLIATHSYVRPGIFPGTTTPRASGRGGLLLGRLAVIPTGPTLAHTLLLSLPLGERDPRDVPPWRRTDAPVIAAPVPGPVSYLTWQTRHVLLDAPAGGRVHRVKVAASAAPDPLIPRDQQAAHDPHLIFTAQAKAADGWAITGYDPDRALWREAAALAAYDGRASALSRAREMLAEDPGTALRIEVIGVAVESTAKYVDWNRTSVTLPLDPAALPYAQKAAQLADLGGGAVRKAALRFLAAIGSLSPTAAAPAKIAAAQAATRGYWAALATPGFSLAPALDAAATPEARAALLDGWAEHIRDAALHTLTRLRDPYGTAPNAVAAHASALRTLRRQLSHDPADHSGEDTPAAPIPTC